MSSANTIEVQALCKTPPFKDCLNILDLSHYELRYVPGPLLSRGAVAVMPISIDLTILSKGVQLPGAIL